MANESQAKMKARAEDLVLNSTIGIRQVTSWYALLNECNKEYVFEVVKAYIAEPDAQLQLVAVALKAELNIKVSVSTIARTLREMIRDDEKTKQN